MSTALRVIAGPGVSQRRAARLREIANTLAALQALLLDEVDLLDRQDGEDDPLLTVAEAAAELRCSERHIRAECERKHLAGFKNGSWFVRRSALRAYERRRTA